MMLKKIIAAAAIVLILLPTAASLAADAESAEHATEAGESRSVVLASQSNGDVENLFLFRDDTVVQGVTNRQDYYFEISPSRRVVEGSYIELFFGHSTTLLPDRSTMTVLLDDIPLESIRLDNSNRENASWKIDIGGMDLEPGFHKLSVFIRMEASDNLCVDQNNPANWVRLHKESVVHLQMAHRFEESDLSWYPSPFMEKGSVEPFRTAFVLPDRPSESEWLALAAMSRFFSDLNAAAIRYEVLRESDLANSAGVLEDRHLVWIGSPDSWTSAGAELWRGIGADAGKLSAGDGLVHLQSSSWNEDKLMLLITGDDAGLREATAHMTHAALYGQLAGSTAVMTKGSSASAATAQEPAMSANRNHVTFASLDYGDLVVESMLVGTARIVYNVPPEWDISRGGKLRINYSHSKTLNYAQSLAMIKINNMPVASANLNESTSEFGTLEADIPASALQGNLLVADISFQFSSSGDACSGNTQIGNWAVIHNDSYFSFTALPNRDLSLASLPHPLVTGRAWNPTALLVPEAPTSEELSLFAIVNGLYGGGLNTYDKLAIMTYPERVSGEEEWLGRNMLAVGLGERLPAWLNEAATIPLTYAAQGWRINNERVGLAESSREESAVMQVFPSPYANERDIVLFSGRTANDLVRLGEVLTDRDDRGKLGGQVAVVDSLHRMHTFDTDQYEPAQSLWDDIVAVLATGNMPIVQRLLIIGGIAAVLALFAFVIWLTRRRRHEREDL